VELQRKASSKLARLAASKDRHGELIAMGGVRELISLAFAEDEHVQRRVAMALADLAEVEYNRITIILEGALMPLIENLMRSEVGSVRDDAARCLQQLAVAEKPMIHDLRLPEPLVEQMEVYPHGVFVGGKEGESAMLWSRMVPVQAALEGGPGGKDGEEEEEAGNVRRYKEGGAVYTLLLVGQGRAYTPVSGDLGFRLHFSWVPVSTTGIRGAEQIVVTKAPVTPGQPHVTGVSVRRANPEEASLIGSGTYHGGAEGEAVYVWRRVNPKGRMEVIRDANEIGYYPSTTDLNCRMQFGYIPIRADGVRGNVTWSPLSDLVTKFRPTFVDFGIEGHEMEGVELWADGKFRGWEEGPHRFQWWRANAISNWEYTVINGASEQAYVPIVNDIGSLLKVTCTPLDDLLPYMDIVNPRFYSPRSHASPSTHPAR